MSPHSLYLQTPKIQQLIASQPNCLIHIQNIETLLANPCDREDNTFFYRNLLLTPQPVIDTLKTIYTTAGYRVREQKSDDFAAYPFNQLELRK